MQMVGPAFMDYVLNGRVAGPIGNRHPLGAAAPHGVFPCAGDDRWISIAVFDDAEWRGLVRAMGAPDWASAPRSQRTRGAVRHIDAIHEPLAAWTRGFDDRELAAAPPAPRRRRGAGAQRRRSARRSALPGARDLRRGRRTRSASARRSTAPT